MYIFPKTWNLTCTCCDLKKVKKLILLGDFSSGNKIWGKNLTRNTKTGNILEEILNQHNIFLLTDVDHTYHHSGLNENAGKSTIDLT